MIINSPLSLNKISFLPYSLFLIVFVSGVNAQTLSLPNVINIPYSQSFGPSHFVANTLNGITFYEVNSSATPPLYSIAADQIPSLTADSRIRNTIVNPDEFIEGVTASYATSGNILSYESVGGNKSIGIGFGGRSQGFIIGLNFTGWQNVTYSYKAKLAFRTSSTISGAVLLQYRVGISGVWNTVAQTTFNPTTLGETVTFSGSLPLETYNNNNVYLRYATFQNGSYTASDFLVITIDDIAIQGEPFVPAKYNVRVLSSSVEEKKPFAILVEAQNIYGNLANLPTSANFRIKAGGTGTLSGVTTGTIFAGSSSTTLTGLSYFPYQSGVPFIVESISGYALSTSVQSFLNVTSFPGAYKLRIVRVVPETGSTLKPGARFFVVAQSLNQLGNPRNVVSNTQIRVNKVFGAGTLGGGTVALIPSGLNTVTLTGVTYSTVETGLQLNVSVTNQNPGDPLLPSESFGPLNVGKKATQLTDARALPEGSMYANRPIYIELNLKNEAGEMATVQFPTTLTATVLSGSGNITLTTSSSVVMPGDTIGYVRNLYYDAVENAEIKISVKDGTLLNSTTITIPFIEDYLATRKIKYLETFESTVSVAGTNFWSLPNTMLTINKDGKNAGNAYIDYGSRAWVVENIQYQAYAGSVYLDNLNYSNIHKNKVGVATSNLSDPNAQSDRWLITPKVSIGDKLTKFDFQSLGLNPSAAVEDKFSVYITDKSISNTSITLDDWTLLNTLKGDSILASKNVPQWHSYILPDTYKNKDIQIAIRLRTSGTFGDRLAVDNLMIYEDESPTGVKSTLRSTVAEVYPNPSNGNFAVLLPVDTHILEATLIDASGRVQVISPLKLAKNGFLTFIISNLKTGIYNLNIKSDKGVFISKLFVNN